MKRIVCLLLVLALSLMAAALADEQESLAAAAERLDTEVAGYV